jgi:hypothetical protein
LREVIDPRHLLLLRLDHFQVGLLRVVLLDSDLNVLRGDAASILGLQKEKLGKSSALFGVRSVS